MDPFGLTQTIDRVRGVLRTEWPHAVVEVGVIAVVVYLILRFLRGTRGARLFKGLMFILIVVTLTIQLLVRENKFERLNYLFSNFLALVSLMVVIVFQPELRRALMRLGEARLFRQSGFKRRRIVDELLDAVQYLARNKIGALIAIEGEVGLRGIVEHGVKIDAEVTKELLNTIFWPGSALHDMGVVIRGDRIMAAGVQFPLTDDESLPQELGSRHRAAIGLSGETDALVIIVSEETGVISIAERGELTRGLSTDQLRPILSAGLDTVRISDPSEPVIVADADAGESLGRDPSPAATLSSDRSSNKEAA